jgi:hypothetical protein
LGSYRTTVLSSSLPVVVVWNRGKGHWQRRLIQVQLLYRLSSVQIIEKVENLWFGDKVRELVGYVEGLLDDTRPMKVIIIIVVIIEFRVLEMPCVVNFLLQNPNSQNKTFFVTCCFYVCVCTSRNTAFVPVKGSRFKSRGFG